MPRVCFQYPPHVWNMEHVDHIVVCVGRYAIRFMRRHDGWADHDQRMSRQLAKAERHSVWKWGTSLKALHLVPAFPKEGQDLPFPLPCFPHDFFGDWGECGMSGRLSFVGCT